MHPRTCFTRFYLLFFVKEMQRGRVRKHTFALYGPLVGICIILQMLCCKFCLALLTAGAQDVSVEICMPHCLDLSCEGYLQRDLTLRMCGDWWTVRMHTAPSYVIVVWLLEPCSRSEHSMYLRSTDRQSAVISFFTVLFIARGCLLSLRFLSTIESVLSLLMFC